RRPPPPPPRPPPPRGPCREGHAARELEATVRGREGLARHERGDERRRRHAERDGAGGGREADGRKRGPRHPALERQQRQSPQRQRAKRLRHRHEASPRHAIGENAERKRKEKEGGALR